MEKGQGDFAAIAEVAPIILKKVADTATLENAILNIGEKLTLTPSHPENTILKGIVWSSSDENIVKVNQNGAITGVTVGTAKIKITNAAGLTAESTVTVKTTEVPSEVDKTFLGTVINYAETVKEEGALNGVVPAVVNEFEAALEEAKLIFANSNATESEVNEASKRLINAIHMLEFKKGDKAQLIKLVGIINALDGSKYKPSTWSALQSELEKANKVIEDENAMESEVKDSYNKLIKAYLDLRLIPDKSKLEELINKAEAIDTTKYTEESVDNLNKYLANVKSVLDNKEASQEEVDKAAEDLELAIADLKEIAKADDNDKNNNNSTGGNTNNSITDNSGKGNSNSNLPSTGGTSPIAVGLFATLITLLGFVMSRKRKNA